MTEKLLLYGGALQQAGAVRMKGEQRATQSDFMEMEKQRGPTQQAEQAASLGLC